MKVKFKYGIRTYSGTLDEMTYGSYRKHSLCIGRKHVKPALTVQNDIMGAITKNLHAIYLDASTGYKADLKAYAKQNGKENVKNTQMPPNSYALFIKMMYAWQEDSGGTVDLSSITLEDIQSTNAAVGTVADAIDAGYLKPVTNYDIFFADI